MFNVIFLIRFAQTTLSQLGNHVGVGKLYIRVVTRAAMTCFLHNLTITLGSIVYLCKILVIASPHMNKAQGMRHGISFVYA